MIASYSFPIPEVVAQKPPWRHLQQSSVRLAGHPSKMLAYDLNMAENLPLHEQE
jgi:hypothetical protein